MKINYVLFSNSNYRDYLVIGLALLMIPNIIATMVGLCSKKAVNNFSRLMLLYMLNVFLKAVLIASLLSNYQNIFLLVAVLYVFVVSGKFALFSLQYKNRIIPNLQHYEYNAAMQYIQVLKQYDFYVIFKVKCYHNQNYALNSKVQITNYYTDKIIKIDNYYDISVNFYPVHGVCLVYLGTKQTCDTRTMAKIRNTRGELFRLHRQKDQFIDIEPEITCSQLKKQFYCVSKSKLYFFNQFCVYICAFFCFEDILFLHFLVSAQEYHFTIYKKCWSADNDKTVERPNCNTNY